MKRLRNFNEIVLRDQDDEGLRRLARCKSQSAERGGEIAAWQSDAAWSRARQHGQCRTVIRSSVIHRGRTRSVAAAIDGDGNRAAAFIHRVVRLAEADDPALRIVIQDGADAD